MTPNADCTKYRLFFETPNADLPVSAPSADGVLKILPVQDHALTDPIADWQPVLDASNTVQTLSFTESLTASNKAGQLTISLDPDEDFAGNFLVEVDTNNNGVYNDAVDRAIDASASGGAANANITASFDGKNGLGADIAPNATINFRVKFDKLAEIHLVVLDVEAMSGLTIRALNGPEAGDATVYWDDTALVPYTNDDSMPYNTTPLIDGTAGVDSGVLGGVRGWPMLATLSTGEQSFFGWGNTRALDTWVYQSVNVVDSHQASAGPHYVVKFESNGGNSIGQQKLQPLGKASRPTAPVYDGYIFDDWYVDTGLTTLYDFDTSVDKDITLYAKWLAACQYDEAISDTDPNCQAPPINHPGLSDPVYSGPVVNVPDTGYQVVNVVWRVLAAVGALVWTAVLGLTVWARWRNAQS
jgi:uncharacterized repeat protein (TIGR02543 family)